MAEGFVGLGGSHDVSDKGGPVFGPFVLEDLDEDHIEFGHVHLLLLHQFGVRGRLDDETDDVLFNALALTARKSLPPRLDNVL